MAGRPFHSPGDRTSYNIDFGPVKRPVKIVGEVINDPDEWGATETIRQSEEEKEIIAGSGIRGESPFLNKAA